MCCCVFHTNRVCCCVWHTNRVCAVYATLTACVAVRAAVCYATLTVCVSVRVAAGAGVCALRADVQWEAAAAGRRGQRRGPLGREGGHLLLGAPQEVSDRHAHQLDLSRGSANFLSRGTKNKMLSLGGPQLLGKKKPSAHFNIVLLYRRRKNYMPVNKSRQQ